MTRVKLKVCGITSLADAEAAVAYGADYLGFNFYAPSPRYIAPAAARAIIEHLPPSVLTVGIFVNEPSPDAVLGTLSRSGVKFAQLHGDESVEYCVAVGADRVIKAFRVGEDFDPARLRDYPVRAILLDAFDPRLYGGTGKRVDWGIAADVARQFRLFLAGGLRPENMPGNVYEAVRAVRPYAVDLNSGVEIAPGIKDASKLALLAEQLARITD